MVRSTLQKNSKILCLLKFSEHKKFTKEKNVPSSGGIFFLFVIFYLSESLNYINFAILILIFLLGVFSDLNKITSPMNRILIQSLFIISYIFINDLVVINTRIDLTVVTGFIKSSGI